MVLEAVALRNGTRGAVLVAAGVLLPVAFHAVGASGSIFLPMHIPVLLAGLLCGPVTGALVGILTPVCSALLTGMPPLFPALPVMIPELAAYGGVAGALRRHFSLFPALIAAMLMGRLVAGMMVWLLSLFMALTWTPWAYLTAMAAKGIPGLIIQFLFIPLLVKRLKGGCMDESKIW